MKRWVMVEGNLVVNVTLDYNRPFNNPMWKEIDKESLVNIGWIYENGAFKHPEDETLTELEITE